MIMSKCTKMNESPCATVVVNCFREGPVQRISNSNKDSQCGTLRGCHSTESDVIQLYGRAGQVSWLQGRCGVDGMQMMHIRRLEIGPCKTRK